MDPIEFPEILSESVYARFAHDELAAEQARINEFLNDENVEAYLNAADLSDDEKSERIEAVEALMAAEEKIATLIADRDAERVAAEREADLKAKVAAKAAAKAEREALAAEEAEAAESVEDEDADDEPVEDELAIEQADPGDEDDAPAEDDAELSAEDSDEDADEIDAEAVEVEAGPEVIAAAVKAAVEAALASQVEAVEGTNVPARSDAAEPVAEKAGTISIKAAAGLNGYNVGEDVADAGAVAKAVFEQGHKGVTQKGVGRTEMAVFEGDYPAEFTMTDSAEDNRNKMDAIIAGVSDRIAAGAEDPCGQLCGCPTPIYDNFGCAPEQESYILRAFPEVFSPRGQFCFSGEPQPVDCDGAPVDSWDYAVGYCDYDCAGEVTPLTEKPCVALACGEQESCQIMPISACMKFDVLQSRTWDEGTQRAMARVMAAHTRIKDSILLKQLECAADCVLEMPARGGAFGSVPYQMSLLLEKYAYDFQLSKQGCPIHMLIPSIIPTAMFADRMLSMFDRCVCTDNSITAFSGTEVAVQIDTYRYAPEGSPMAAEPFYADKITDCPDLCWPASARLYITGPVGNVFVQTQGRYEVNNIITGDDLAQNCFRTFFEDFIGLCKVGTYPVIPVDIELCTSGQTSAPIDVDCCGLPA